VYTAEEVALIMKDKLIRLQSLYIEQFKRLQHVMKERRRKYLHTVGQEKESYGICYYHFTYTCNYTPANKVFLGVGNGDGQGVQPICPYFS